MGDRQAYILVHGAFHGGWCWNRVEKILTENGGHVYTPTLTGLCDRSHLATSAINLSTHVQDIVNLILWNDLKDIVLCGHSYAGMVISEVAERVPERIKSLVYLDAVRPGPGQSFWDIIPQEVRDYFETLREGDYFRPVPAENFQVNEADRALVDSKCTPQPRATFMERLSDTSHRNSIRRQLYVVAGGYDTDLLANFADQAVAEGWERIDIPHGHDLMIDAPSEVANILEYAAG